VPNVLAIASISIAKKKYNAPLCRDASHSFAPVINCRTNLAQPPETLSLPLIVEKRSGAALTTAKGPTPTLYLSLSSMKCGRDCRER